MQFDLEQSKIFGTLLSVVTGLLSEADACPNLGSKNIGLLSEAVSCPN